MAKYRITGPDGATYEVTAPDGTSEQEVLDYAKSQFGAGNAGGVPAGQDTSAGVQALRYAGLFSKGFADSALETLATPLEASGKLSSLLGGNYQSGDWTRRLKDAYASMGRTMAEPVDRAIQSTMGPVNAGPAVPQSGSERFVYGAGRGAADAASVYLPAAAVAKGAQAGSVAQRVGATLAESPALQLAAGSAGAGVSESTGSPLLGVATAFALPVGAALTRSVISPFENRLTPEMRRLASVAKESGIPLTAGQKTGSKGLQLTESVFNRLPMTAGSSEAQRQVQRDAFNRAVLGKAGVDATEATPEVLNSARRQIGSEFTRLSNRNNLIASDKFVSDLAKISDDVGRFSVPDVARPVQNRIDDILSKIGKDGVMPGKAYREVDSAIGKTMGSTANGDLRNYLGQVRDSLRSAMDESISPMDQKAWKEARRQYANLMTIAKAMNVGTNEAIAGNIPPSQLMAAVRSQSKNAGAFGRGDLADLARVGKAFVRDSVPDSGTAQRNFLQNLLTMGTGAGGAGVIGMDPTGIAATAAGVYAAPKAAQMAYNNPVIQRYLTNEFLRNHPSLDSALSTAALRPVALEQATTNYRGLLNHP